MICVIEENRRVKKRYTREKDSEIGLSNKQATTFCNINYAMSYTTFQGNCVKTLFGYKVRQMIIDMFCSLLRIVSIYFKLDSNLNWQNIFLIQKIEIKLLAIFCSSNKFEFDNLTCDSLFAYSNSRHNQVVILHDTTWCWMGDISKFNSSALQNF